MDQSRKDEMQTAGFQRVDMRVGRVITGEDFLRAKTPSYCNDDRFQ